MLGSELLQRLAYSACDEAGKRRLRVPRPLQVDDGIAKLLDQFRVQVD